MSPIARRLLFWTPRVLTILFAVFISVFALDVFGEHYSPGQLLVALGMHLIPTALIVVALLVAWRWEWVGAVLFFGLGVLYIVTVHDRASWDWYLFIAGPLFLVGLLFLLNWRYRAELRRRT
jgi:hypothetical protein